MKILSYLVLCTVGRGQNTHFQANNKTERHTLNGISLWVREGGVSREDVPCVTRGPCVVCLYFQMGAEDKEGEKKLIPVLCQVHVLPTFPYLFSLFLEQQKRCIL